MLIILLTFLTLALVNMQQDCNLMGDLSCDADTYCIGATTITALPNTTYACTYPLNLTATGTISITGGVYTGLTLTSNQVKITDIGVSGMLNISYQSTVNISGGLNAVRGVLAISANNNNPALNNTAIYISNANITANNFILLSGQIYLTDSVLQTDGPGSNVCIYTNLSLFSYSLDLTNPYFNKSVNNIMEEPFTFFILALQIIQLDTSMVNTSIAVIISKNSIGFNYSVVSSSAMACKCNLGNGRGSIIQYMNITCTSGSSSCGYGSPSSPACLSTLGYFQFLTHSFPYMTKGPFLYSGSGGYGYSILSNSDGAGGGIIFLLAKQTILMNKSMLLAEGGLVKANDMLSAGSGGTIFVYSENLIGEQPSNISAAGGASFNNNGSGGGGLVKISYNNTNLTSASSIWINISAGYQPIPVSNNNNTYIYSSGVFYGPVCQAGYYSVFLKCYPCGYNQFSNLGDPICRQCPTSNEFLQSFSEKKSSMGECMVHDRKSSLSMWFTPGNISLIGIAVYLASLIICGIIGACLRSKRKKEKMREEMFKLEDERKEIEDLKLMTQKLKTNKSVKCYELMYHVHRIACYGFNTEESPWFLPEIPPEDVRKYVLPHAFQNFAQSFNKKAKWTALQYYTTKVFSLVYPIYWFIMDWIKKKKFDQLSTLLEEAKEFNLINNYDYQDKDIITIKFSKSKDYTVCYLDFFLYQKSDLRYFNLNTPFIVNFSGEGNFLRPFYLEDQDVFLKCMYFIVSRNVGRVIDQSNQHQELFGNLVNKKQRHQNSSQLLKFIRKLNSISCTLDLSSPIATFADTLALLTQFLQRWNGKFFSKVAMQIDLILMISTVHRVGGGVDDQIHILTKRNSQYFKDFITEKIEESTYDPRKTIKIGLFVYNPDQQIPQQSVQKIKSFESPPSPSQDNEGDQSIRQTFITYQHSLQVPVKPSVIAKMSKFIRLIRYCMFSHKLSSRDQYLVKFITALFILMQTLLVCIYQTRIQFPYVFMNLVSPFFGVIWIISDSYGIGKLFLIFNSMSFINQIVSTIVYASIELAKNHHNELTRYIIETVVTGITNIILCIFVMAAASRAITTSKKLSLKKKEEL